ncbi:MAG: glutamate--tRNA ligase [Chlorobi bacterium]|nr:glutamate--tRNA ligase [Chlorobiota bacterium]
MNTRKVRVRFAPSPTGPLHIGGVRTALFNYLFAKKNQGDFILRIEDTDQTRFVNGAEEYIIESLKWCGLKFDEGVNVGGKYGPYRQSERKDIYKQYAKKLLNSGHAYYAFDTAEELNAARKESEAKKQTFTYDAVTRKKMNNSLSLSNTEIESRLNNGISYVIRFKIPQNIDLEMNDIIRGKVTVNTNALDDKVLFKSDGMPTYHLANIVDDHLMEISHVIRGEEWLPSLPLHILLYKALGWENTMPEFAHLPLLLKPNGNGKLSKRDGDKLGFPVFPLEWKSPDGEIFSGYKEAGYFPDAFINMLAFLGWNPGTEKELFTLDELVDAFSFDRVGKSGSKFDPEKTKWYNHHYLIKKDDEELAKLFQKELITKNITVDITYVTKICGIVKERVNFVSELWEQAHFFFQAPVEFDAKTVKKRWKENTPAIIRDIKNIILGIEYFDASTAHDAIFKYIEAKELGTGQVMNALRLIIVGSSKGPDLFTIIELIGKEELLKRIDYALENIKR